MFSVLFEVKQGHCSLLRQAIFKYVIYKELQNHNREMWNK